MSKIDMWEEPLFIETTNVSYEGNRVFALRDVNDEIDKQQVLKASGRFAHTPQDPEMTDDVFLRIVVEKVGEVARALHEHDGSEAADIHLYKEITQIAAICAARMEGMRQQGRV